MSGISSVFKSFFNNPSPRQEEQKENNKPDRISSLHKDLISFLPNEIIALIFSFLESKDYMNLASVSKKFHEISQICPSSIEVENFKVEKIKAILKADLLKKKNALKAEYNKTAEKWENASSDMYVLEKRCREIAIFKSNQIWKFSLNNDDYSFDNPLIGGELFIVQNSLKNEALEASSRDIVKNREIFANFRKNHPKSANASGNFISTIWQRIKQ